MKSALGLAILLALPITVGAHRLDEYLQATRIDLARDRIELRVDLTPGVEVAARVLAAIDSDGDGRINSPEQQKYIRCWLRETGVELDGKRLAFEVVRMRFPERPDLLAGEGSIQWVVRAKFTTLKEGTHQIAFHNDHLPEVSVYLANALVPSDKGIALDPPVRDESQRKYTLKFRVSAPVPRP